jgi:hypothetical protein
MPSFPNQVCEVCGVRKRKEGNWFLLVPNRRGDVLRILYWSEGVAQRRNVWACCSPQHVQVLVERWLIPEESESTGGLASRPESLLMSAQMGQQLRAALLEECLVGPEALSSGFAFEEQSTSSILQAVETLLQGYGADLEEEAEDANEPAQFDS